MSQLVRIATRKSALALWQAHHVADLLQQHHKELKVEFLPLSTRGDRILDTPLAKIGGKGLFLKELERALLDGDADIAVHSMKDIPVEMTQGLVIDAVLERANPSDAWISEGHTGIDDLQPGSVVGTSSLRRQAQLLDRRPDLAVKSLRGNVNTRIEKFESGDYNAIILATAGLERLEMADRISAQLPATEWLPAPAQGAIGIQCRGDDERISSLIQPLDDKPTRQVVTTERALSHRLGGSCQMPLAAFAEQRSGNLIDLRALVGSSDGRRIIRAKVTAPRDRSESAAEEAARVLLSQGAEDIIRSEIEMANR